MFISIWMPGAISSNDLRFSYMFNIVTKERLSTLNEFFTSFDLFHLLISNVYTRVHMLYLCDSVNVTKYLLEDSVHSRNITLQRPELSFVEVS